MATEAARLNGNNLEKEEIKKKKEKMKEKEEVDTHRPSHGRSWQLTARNFGPQDNLRVADDSGVEAYQSTVIIETASLTRD